MKKIISRQKKMDPLKKFDKNTDGEIDHEELREAEKLLEIELREEKAHTHLWGRSNFC